MVKKQLGNANHWRPRVRLPSLLALVWLPTLTYAIGPAGPSWLPREFVSDSVRFEDHHGADRILAFDHHGQPGIAFRLHSDVTLGDLHLARKVPGFGWLPADLEPGNTLGKGRFPSLAFDRHERPMVVYQNAAPASFESRPRIAHFDGAQWQHQNFEIITTEDFGFWNSLAFDQLGRAAFASVFDADHRFRFVHDTDGDFDFSDEVSESSPAIFPVSPINPTHLSLAFDAFNRPMLSYIADNNELMFAVRTEDQWFVRTIDEAVGSIEIASSMAIDPDTGFPVIAYTSVTLSAELRVAVFDGANWVIETVDSAGSTGAMPSIAFDPTDGNPAIAYHDLNRGNLDIAWYDGTEWQTDIVDDGGNVDVVGLNPSIAFREYGEGDRVAAIAYHDDVGNLWYIEDPVPLTAVPLPPSVVLMLSAAGWLLRSRRCWTAAQLVG